MKTIRELLTDRSPISVPGTMTVLDAAKTMHAAKIGALLVDDAKGTVGVFTERDLMARVVVAGLDPATTPIANVMTRDLFTAGPDERINEIARRLQERHIRHLPVIEDGKVIGMLSLRDLLREHVDVKRSEVQALTAYIQGEGDAAP